MRENNTAKKKPAGKAAKNERKSRRKTPLPPLCPVHRVPMLSGHSSEKYQYRYCRIEGCRESLRVDRVYRLQNAMCLWLWGKVDKRGRVRLHRHAYTSRKVKKIR
jgi:hypothetical protein